MKRIVDMAGPAGPIRGRADDSDRLLEADEPLAGLQMRSGGDLPGPIAVPALLALVRKARHLQMRLSRTIRILDDGTEVAVWASVEPVEGGSAIELSQWQASALTILPDDHEAERDLIRHLAEGYAWLDSGQRILSADLQAPDLAELQAAFTAGRGCPWTDFVVVEGSAHRQPLHWRLLDRATVRAPGSDRAWRVHILPRAGLPPSGFELCLVPVELSEVPPPMMPSAEPAEDYGRLMGRELAPALRRPISRIIGNAETIRTRLAGPLADQYSAYAADIAHAGQHLLNLVEDLADLEAVESMDFLPVAERIDLADLGRQAAGLLSVRASDRAIALMFPPAGYIVPATGESRRVLQILLNLLSNAIRYSPEGTTVTVAAGIEDREAWIAVGDQGAGLNDEQAARVFEKFERLGRKGDGGSGLGLYISRKLARAMSGDLTVESAPGEGARFILTLPRAVQ